MKPTPVMYVIWSLGLGGAEQVVIRLAVGLDRRRFSPLIVCLNEPGPFASQARRAGIEVLALHKRGAIDLGMLIRLVRLMRQRRPQIVHTHLWGANCWGRIAARLAGVPVLIAHEHGMQPWRRAPHFVFDAVVARITHRILFASHQVMQTYQRKTRTAPAKCRVIPNGVAWNGGSEDRERLRAAQGCARGDRLIISVGRLSPEKGYADLLRAFAILARRVPEARLILIGDGPERDALQRLHVQCGVQGAVTFAGAQEQVGSWLAAADLYVQPSRREGLPLAVLEAMAAGVPVIATQVGDLERLITDGHDGHLVPAASPDALAAKMLEVLERLDGQGPLIHAARRLVRGRYALAQMVREVETVYEEACAR